MQHGADSAPLDAAKRPPRALSSLDFPLSPPSLSSFPLSLLSTPGTPCTVQEPPGFSSYQRFRRESAKSSPLLSKGPTHNGMNWQETCIPYLCASQMQQLFTQRVKEYKLTYKNTYENLNHLRFLSHTSGSVVNLPKFFWLYYPLVRQMMDGMMRRQVSIPMCVIDDAAITQWVERINRRTHANGNGWNL